MNEEELLREIAQLEDLVAALNTTVEAITAERDLLKAQIHAPLVSMEYVNNLRAAYTKKCLEHAQAILVNTVLRESLSKVQVEVIDAIKPG